jgi:hypothetical protein
MTIQKKALENLVTAEKLLEKANIRVLISDPYVGRKALLGLSKQDEALAEFQRMLDLAAVEELFDKLGTHLRGLRDIVLLSGSLRRLKKFSSRLRKYIKKSFKTNPETTSVLL